MEETLYRHLLRDSWRITWKNPFLWVLGALSVFWGGVGAYSVIDSLFDRVAPGLSPIVEGGALPALSDFTQGALIVVGIFTVVLLCLFAGFIVLTTSARGGLIYSIGQRFEKKPAATKVALKKGIAKFWPILGIGILSRFDILLAYVFLRPLVDIVPGTWVLILYVLAFVVTTVISLVFSLLAVYAIAFVMFEELSFVKAILQACTLFFKHWLLSLEFALLLYGLNLLVGIAVVIGFLALGIPFVLLGVLFAFLNVPGGFLVVMVPLMILYMIFLVVAGSAFVTFQYTTWMLLYMRMREGNPVSKVVRASARYAHIFHRKII